MQIDQLQAAADRVVRALESGTAPTAEDIELLCDRIDLVIWDALHTELRLYRAAIRDGFTPESGWAKMVPWVKLGLFAVTQIESLIEMAQSKVDAVVGDTASAAVEPLGH